ncbi:hypothetical protein SO802_009240, partial [Lithocarpus litseifolius]
VKPSDPDIFICLEKSITNSKGCHDSFFLDSCGSIFNEKCLQGILPMARSVRNNGAIAREQSARSARKNGTIAREESTGSSRKNGAITREESDGSARNNGAIAREELARSAKNYGAIPREESAGTARNYGAIKREESGNKKGRWATWNLNLAKLFTKERFPIMWKKGRLVGKYSTVFKSKCTALVRRISMEMCDKTSMVVPKTLSLTLQDKKVSNNKVKKSSLVFWPLTHYVFARNMESQYTISGWLHEKRRMWHVKGGGVIWWQCMGLGLRTCADATKMRYCGD